MFWSLECALKCHSFVFIFLKLQCPLSICHQVNEDFKPSSKTFNCGKMVLYQIGIEMSIILFPHWSYNTHSAGIKGNHWQWIKTFVIIYLFKRPTHNSLKVIVTVDPQQIVHNLIIYGLLTMKVWGHINLTETKCDNSHNICDMIKGNESDVGM